MGNQVAKLKKMGDDLIDEIVLIPMEDEDENTFRKKGLVVDVRRKGPIVEFKNELPEDVEFKEVGEGYLIPWADIDGLYEEDDSDDEEEEEEDSDEDDEDELFVAPRNDFKEFASEPNNLQSIIRGLRNDSRIQLFRKVLQDVRVDSSKGTVVVEFSKGAVLTILGMAKNSIATYGNAILGLYRKIEELERVAMKGKEATPPQDTKVIELNAQLETLKSEVVNLRGNLAESQCVVKTLKIAKETLECQLEDALNSEEEEEVKPRKRQKKGGAK